MRVCGREFVCFKLLKKCTKYTDKFDRLDDFRSVINVHFDGNTETDVSHTNICDLS